jgi:hypothetical protein
MAFAGINSSSEYLVSYSSRPMGVIFLEDNVAFSLSKVLGLSFDLNNSINQVIVSGDFSPTRNQQLDLNNFESFLNNSLFSFTPGKAVIDLNQLKDGAAEVFFGNSLQGDYNYNNSSFALFPLSSATLSSVDINIRASGDLNRVDWNTTAGALVVTINYTDDSNSFTVSTSVDPNTFSALTLVYNDSNSIISMGNAYKSYNNSVKIVSAQNHRMDYLIKATYSSPQVFLPIRFNSTMVSSSPDYNVYSNLNLVN